MVTHNYLLLLTTTKSIYASGVIHWTCRVYFTLLGVNSSGVSALDHKPCSVNLAFYYYYYYYYYHYHYHYHYPYHYHYHYRYRYRYRYRYYYYFTHLDTQKTPKTSDSLKPTENKRSNKSPEFRQVSAVVTARPRLGTAYKWGPHKTHKGRERNCWDYMRKLLHTL